MNILILNWRDIKNPRAGGAELLTHEIAKRWVAAGHAVTMFSERFEGAISEEVVDGVTIIRRGRWWSVHLLAMFYYFFRGHRSIDIIVDEVHWFPFFSILYAPKKTVLLVCEVADRLFFYLFPYPLAIVGKFVEKAYIALYHQTPVIAISPSTKAALIREGISSSHITVIPMGVSVPRRAKLITKATHFTVIVVGRLHVLKGMADAIQAFAKIHDRLPSASMWIVGGDTAGYQGELERLADRYGIGGNVTFFGRVSEEKKFALLSRAHLFLMPSVHEGWGLVIAEAAFQGTPAIGYRTAGIQDVIIDGKTGILVPIGKPETMAEEALKLWRDRPRYLRYQQAARKRAASMRWDDTARVALGILQRQNEKT